MKELSKFQNPTAYPCPRVYMSCPAQISGVKKQEKQQESKEEPEACKGKIAEHENIKATSNEPQGTPTSYEKNTRIAQSAVTSEDIFSDGGSDIVTSDTEKDDSQKSSYKVNEAVLSALVQTEKEQASGEEKYSNDTEAGKCNPSGNAKASKHNPSDSIEVSKCNPSGSIEVCKYNSSGSCEQQIHSIDVSKIVPNPNQPRKTFPEFSILKLADSIQQFGIIQPLTVRKIGEEYELIAGERRLRAAKEIGLTTVPCIIISSTEEKSAQISIIENLIREDLNIFEQALAIETLIDTYGLTQEQVAKKLSSSQSFIANKLRLLRLSTSEREEIIKNGLTERHARSLLRIKDVEKRQSVLDYIVQNCLNVNETEVYIDSVLNREKSKDDGSAPKKKHEYKDSNAFYTAIIKALDCARYSELPIKTRKIVGESFTEITIIIPNSAENESIDDNNQMAHHIE